MGKITGRLENWTVDQIFKKECIIWGNVYDDIHGRFFDGQVIHTSGITGQQPFKAGQIVTTRNSTYLLGDPLDG